MLVYGLPSISRLQAEETTVCKFTMHGVQFSTILYAVALVLLYRAPTRSSSVKDYGILHY